MPDTTAPAYPMRRACPFEPAAALTRLQSTAPISRVTLWDGSSPWLLTRHEDIRTMLSDDRFSSDPERPGFPAPSAASRKRKEKAVGSFGRLDDPEHARYRKMLIGEFTARRIEALRPQVAETAGLLLDRMAAGPRPADLIDTFALPLPSMVISSLLGVPYTDHEFFEQCSHTIADLRAEPEHAVRADQELSDYLRELVEAKITTPGNDLMSRLIDDHVRTGGLGPAELVSMSLELLFAGHETTANMIGLGTLWLLRNPDRAAAFADAELVPGAVEELLRLLTVTHAGRRRVAVADVELGGVLIQAGEGVIAATDIANRDAAGFPDPEHFEPRRTPNHHLSFGFGVHQCLGQALARLELHVAYPALLRRFPSLALAVPPEELGYRDGMGVYGVEELPVTW